MFALSNDWGDDECWNGALDDKTGEKLDSKLVEMAEAEEMKYMRDLGVGEEVDEQQQRPLPMGRACARPSTRRARLTARGST